MTPRAFYRQEEAGIYLAAKKKAEEQKRNEKGNLQDSQSLTITLGCTPLITRLFATLSRLQKTIHSIWRRIKDINEEILGDHFLTPSLRVKSIIDTTGKYKDHSMDRFL
ncbi:hypothetical protein GcM1_218004 [Golovinomyces cichoracearum]|uniref:Uncharacterized protein n=1 Tax=Golovinomyces cichoracearum TaxID=62708 RepID=A0A420ISL0_9PEZI|nr:hypothetical protein GcM1_218004 [Golovinomyces cichoracearum]